ncbi:MAG: phage resistance protein [Streptosporangiaceae bacterium]
MTAELLRDLIDIPDRVHAGDFVLTLNKGVTQESTVRDYVATPQLARCFDEALGLIQSSVEGRASRAAYLDGSFGSGKSHFMAMLHAILRGDPEARGKAGLVDVVARHDKWLAGRKFLLVPYHMIEAASLESAILGGYVDHVRKLMPSAPLPAVYRDEGLLADARDLRAQLGDEKFIAGLPGDADDEWGEAPWSAASLDAALAAPPGDSERRRLVGDLLAGHFTRYARAVSGTAESFIELDKGLAEISRHARDVLGCDAVVLLLDELVLWLSSYIGDPTRIKTEAQKVSKLVESAEHERPAPIISFVPRQRDLRDLVGRDTAGATTASLFDTLKYWDGRFDKIRLEDSNLPVVVEARLLRPKDAAAKAVIDAAFEQTERSRSEVWDALLDAQGGAASRADFRGTYPFSPAFLHAMVDVSGALQRQRTALRLMQQLLVDYRDTLPVGQLMPLGAIFDALTAGGDRPFSDKLRDEFDQARRFHQRVRDYLLRRHGLTEEQAAVLPSQHAFRADDLIVKTLLLSALVPNVPALRALTASRLAALNHGSIAVMIPGQDRVAVARTLRELSGEFGEIRVSGADDPSVEIALIGVDTSEILRKVINVDDDAARRRLIKGLLWEEFGVTDKGEFITTCPVTWRGTDRVAELVFGNVRHPDLADSQFEPEVPSAIRVVIDYPFDEGNHYPSDDRHRVQSLQERLNRPLALVLLPSFLSRDRLTDLGDLVRICYVLERRDRLEELTPYLAADDRHHARAQLEARKAALTSKLRDALQRAYGLLSPDDADLGAAAEDHIMALDPGLEIRPPVGLRLGEALPRICGQLLDHAYPRHPDFDRQARQQVLRKTELSAVLAAVERAAQDKVGRLEVPATDLPVLRRIANPLNIATVGEVLVLRDDWKLLIERRAAGTGPTAELKIGDIRRWIAEEQPGLPALVSDLLVACFAVQSDRAWFRAGQPVPPPEIGRITPDMMLRPQELPSEGEFGLAGERAGSVFGLGSQPVRSARAVQALAAELRSRAGSLLPAAESLVSELERHAATLGLADDSPRLVTARTAAELLNRLTGLADPTALLRALAASDLPREGAVYDASLAGAGELTASMGRVRWQILDQLATVAGGGAGPKAEVAASVSDQLSSAARHDEHQVKLRGALDQAERAAIDLLIQVPPPAGPPGPVPAGIRPPGGPPPPPPGESDPGAFARRVRASEVAAVAAKLRETADKNPGASFDVSWRIVAE